MERGEVLGGLSEVMGGGKWTQGRRRRRHGGGAGVGYRGAGWGGSVTVTEERHWCGGKK